MKGFKIKTPDHVSKSNQNHGIPALVLLIPGLRQMIKRHFIMGFIIWVIGSLAAVSLWWTVIEALFIYVWDLNDA